MCCSYSISLTDWRNCTCSVGSSSLLVARCWQLHKADCSWDWNPRSMAR